MAEGSANPRRGRKEKRVLLSRYCIPHYAVSSSDLLARDVAPHVCCRSDEDLVVRSITQFSRDLIETPGVAAFAFCSSHEDPFPTTLTVAICLKQLTRSEESIAAKRIGELDAELAERIGLIISGELQFLDAEDDSVEGLQRIVQEYCDENSLEGLGLLTAKGE